MPAPQDLDQLAAKLGRPPTALSAFSRLTPAQIGFLVELIDGACARERRAVEAALRDATPPLTGRILLGILRRRAR